MIQKSREIWQISKLISLSPYHSLTQAIFFETIPVLKQRVAQCLLFHPFIKYHGYHHQSIQTETHCTKSTRFYLSSMFSFHIKRLEKKKSIISCVRFAPVVRFIFRYAVHVVLLQNLQKQHHLPNKVCGNLLIYYQKVKYTKAQQMAK